MSQKKPFLLRVQRVINGKLTWVEQSFATGYDMSVFYDKQTPRKKRTKRGGQKKQK